MPVSASSSPCRLPYPSVNPPAIPFSLGGPPFPVVTSLVFSSELLGGEWRRWRRRRKRWSMEMPPRRKRVKQVRLELVKTLPSRLALTLLLLLVYSNQLRERPKVSQLIFLKYELHEVLKTIFVLSGVRSVRLEQKREKYLRRRRQLSDVQIGVSRMVYIRRKKHL